MKLKDCYLVIVSLDILHSFLNPKIDLSAESIQV